MIRAAVSEVEEYRRVVLRRVDDALVHGNAVGADRAPARRADRERPDVLAAGLRGRGAGRWVPDGYLIAITDQGIGHGRARTSPGATPGCAARGTSWPPRPAILGHFVVGQLARQTGSAVRAAASRRSPASPPGVHAAGVAAGRGTEGVRRRLRPRIPASWPSRWRNRRPPLPPTADRRRQARDRPAAAVQAGVPASTRAGRPPVGTPAATPDCAARRPAAQLRRPVEPAASASPPAASGPAPAAATTRNGLPKRMPRPERAPVAATAATHPGHRPRPRHRDDHAAGRRRRLAPR